MMRAWIITTLVVGIVGCGNRSTAEIADKNESSIAIKAERASDAREIAGPHCADHGKEASMNRYELLGPGNAIYYFDCV